MTIKADTYIKKGYVPIALNRYAGIALQGEFLRDFWMWNGQYMDCAEGKKIIQSVRVTGLKEAALRYWRDGWIPLGPVDESLLKRMEDALRRHRGLKAQGVSFPDSGFLKMPESLPDDFYVKPKPAGEESIEQRKKGR